MKLIVNNILENFECPIHEKLENSEEESKMVPDNVFLFFGPGSYSTERHRQS